MKISVKLTAIILALFMVIGLVACDESKNKNKNSQAVNSTEYIKHILSDVNSATATSEIAATSEATTETSSEYESLYKTKELSRNSGYKTMEMYVAKNNNMNSRRITFELPEEWRGNFSVFTNDEDYMYNLKVDMWDIIDSTRENVLNEYNDREDSVNYNEKIYSTDSYEIFYYEYEEPEEGVFVTVYYLYANEERFCMSSYIFGEVKPEYKAIFKRIVESVRFQF